MCILEGHNQEKARSESFCGSIKSFNSRRGFGFVSCEETAKRFGRDVYLSKDEAMVLAEEPAVGQTKVDTPITTSSDSKTRAPAPVQEGDFLLFQVKLSLEGFPQAVQAQKIRRLRGVVRQAPSSTADGIIVVTGEESVTANAVTMKLLLGAEVTLRQRESGQLQLQPSDEVAFCCVNDGTSMEAQLVDLLHTQRADGSVLGCFSLSLPQLGEVDDGSPSIQLHGHALTNLVVLSDVPANLNEVDLMRLFSKLGAVDATVAKNNGSAFISFDGPESIAKFLVQRSHTISENGMTQLAHVDSCLYHKYGGPCQCCASNSSALPRPDEANPISVHTNSAAQSPAPSCSCIAGATDVGTVDGRASVSAPILSSTPKQSSQTPTPVSFGCFTEQDNVNFGSLLGPMPEMPMITRNSTAPAWRCMHSNIVLPTAAPEILPAGTDGCSVCIQWPTMIHASAYVVELLDQVSMVTNRFTHVAPAGALPVLMNFQVEGLQPNPLAACIRCVAPCGCESPASPWSFVSGAAAHSLPHSVPASPGPCPPPLTMPPFFSTALSAPASLKLTSIAEESAAGVVSLESCFDPEDILTLD